MCCTEKHIVPEALSKGGVSRIPQMSCLRTDSHPLDLKIIKHIVLPFSKIMCGNNQYITHDETGVSAALYCTCEGVIPSIMVINDPLIVSEYVQPMVILVSFINFAVLQVKRRNVIAYIIGIIV